MKCGLVCAKLTCQFSYCHKGKGIANAGVHRLLWRVDRLLTSYKKLR